ncbi:MAG: DUF262 domain-containing protein, partial [Actinomycetes bacterium]
MDRLEAGELPVSKVLSSDFDFHIPSYQRPYSWGADQALQLLDDLLGALANEENDPYFLGSIVLVKESGKPISEVIDGQQRLTTLTILLSILRDNETDPKIADPLDAMVTEPGNELAGLKPRPRLTLRDRDNAFFENHIQTKGATNNLDSTTIDASQLQTDPQRLIVENALALKAELANHPAETVRALQRLVHNLTYLVVVTTPTKESAFRIFNVMNARGMDLTPADIFKAKIIGAMESTAPGQMEEATAAWEDAEEMLGRADFSDLFLHIRMIFAKERGRRELLVEFEEQVLKGFLPNDAVRFMDDVLVPYAEVHADIRDCSFNGGSRTVQINRWFRLLARIDNNDWRPPALWALNEKRDDPAWLDDYFRKLERLATSMSIRRQNNTQRTTRFGHLLRQLGEGKGLDALALDLDSKEKAETLARLNGDVYGVRG